MTYGLNMVRHKIRTFYLGTYFMYLHERKYSKLMVTLSLFQLTNFKMNMY